MTLPLGSAHRTILTELAPLTHHSSWVVVIERPGRGIYREAFYGPDAEANAGRWQRKILEEVFNEGESR